MSQLLIVFRRVAALVICLSLAACNYNRFEAIEPPPMMGIAPNISLAELSQMYKNDIVNLPESMVIGGVVTSSDSAANFYKRLVIQQGSDAVELKLGLYDIYVSYHVGQSVVLLADGLRITREYGTLTLGAPATTGGARAVDFISSETLIRRRLLRTTWHEPIIVPTLRVANITPKMVGNTVNLSGGYFEHGGVGSWGGEQRYIDANGDSIIVYTNAFATYAKDTLPSGRCDLRGVVTMYQDKLQIKLNSSNNAVPL